MTETDIQKYEKVKFQIDEIYKELSLLSKKKPDIAISKFKLRIVNNLLEIANTLLVDGYKPFDNFNSFDSQALPTNSDVVVMISQYKECLERLKYKNVASLSGEWYWVINNKASKIKTTCPLEYYII